MNQCQLFCELIAHMLRIIKKGCQQEIHTPDRPANQEVNFDIIGNVMTFLTLCAIV